MTQEQLNEILQLHHKWCCGEADGVRANLHRADLRGFDLHGMDFSNVDLSEANLCMANLYGANLYRANLYGTNLYGTDLHRTNLSEANMGSTNLQEANLTEADLRGANLCMANLSKAILDKANLCGTYLHGAILNGASLWSGADLNNVKYNEQTSFYALQCPEEGAFIGYKKCRENRIVKLLITEDALRSSATSRKCRASKAKILEITDDKIPELTYDYATSKHDANFLYRVGEEVSVPNFDTNRWKECATGIHFFITREEAMLYS